MSNRERWVIYPLLFLALGFALKPKFVPPEKIQCQSIQCQSIECNDLIANRTLVARRSIQTGSVNTGTLVVNGSAQFAKSLTVPVIQSTTAISSVVQAKTFSVVDDDGKSRMRMGTQGVAKDGSSKTFDSGRIELYGKNQEPILVLASTDGGESGLMVVGDSAGQNQVILRASPEGGQLSLHDSSDRVQVFAGHLPLMSGVYIRQSDDPNSRIYWLGPLDRSKLPKPKKPVLKKPVEKTPGK